MVHIPAGYFLMGSPTTSSVGDDDEQPQAEVYVESFYIDKYPVTNRQFFEFVQQNPGMRQQIQAPIFEDKVVDHIFDQASVTEKAVTKDELQKAVEARDGREHDQRAVVGVDRQDQAAGLEHAPDFGKRFCDIGHVVEHVVGDHGVKGRILKRDQLGIHQPEVEFTSNVM